MKTRRSRFALPLISFLSGCSFDVSGFDFGFQNTSIDGPLGDGEVTAVEDLASSPDLVEKPDLFGVCPGGRAPTHVDDLAEGDLSNWFGEAPMPWFGQIPPNLKVEADNKSPARGLISVRFTDSSDKGVLSFPKAKNAAWDLSAFTNLRASVAADNKAAQNNPGWQETDPHIRLHTSATDYFEYVPDLNKLPRDPGTWISLSVPLAGGGGWSRSQVGNPSLANVNYLSFSMDTWGFGFRVWFDGVTFEPGPFVDCTP